MAQKYFIFSLLIFLIIINLTKEEACQKIECTSSLPKDTCINVMSSVSMFQECPSGQRCSPEFDDPILDANCIEHKLSYSTHWLLDVM